MPTDRDENPVISAPAGRSTRDQALADWREKVERAKKARDAANQMRRGKPQSFDARRAPAWKSR